MKWNGKAELRGGGHFSGRLTAPLCIAGGIAKQILARRNIFVGAHLKSVAGIADESFPLYPDRTLFETVAKSRFPSSATLPVNACRKRFSRRVRKATPSAGDRVRCRRPARRAWGTMFGGMENRLSAALCCIPAVKGVEFGAGFGSALLKGSQNNDPYEMAADGTIAAKTNNAGGILGGITTGMPLVLRAAIKPTPSIAKPQQTVSLSRRENTELEIRGRHDPCVAHRAVPVVEAVCAIVLLSPAGGKLRFGGNLAAPARYFMLNLNPRKEPTDGTGPPSRASIRRQNMLALFLEAHGTERSGRRVQTRARASAAQ